jgi:GH25 family lysozyme M1 (1,4-beta-N-acetylmuramidase)
MRGRLLAFALMVGCAAGETEGSIDVESIDQGATVCGVGPTLKGIDVSKYQPDIDWSRVAADDVSFAFIRVSDGVNYIDSKFASHWAGSRAAGIKHGAYQFFRPGQDPIAQAEILLDAIGRKLEADDLPPVIDVEASDGQSAAVIKEKVGQWIDHVKGVIGREPIIYTGFYFWRDSVGAPDFTGSPLWHAQYSTASCPNIAPPWGTWAFWQYTDSGTVDGISGGVDMNRFNGDAAAFAQLLGPSGACGDGTCGAGETSITCASDCGPCGTIGYAGGVIDDGDACFESGGPASSMRKVDGTGKDGDLVWTHTTDDDAEANFGQWHFHFEEGGTYTVEVYTDAVYAKSKQAKYVVQAGAASTDVVVDQTAVDGWQSIGEFAFEAGGEQWVRVGDNTGEALANKIQLSFDAVRVTRLEAPPVEEMEEEGTGCNARGQGSLGGLLLLALAFLRRGRRTLA